MVLKLNEELEGESFSIERLDQLIINTGSRPDFSYLSEVKLNIDAAKNVELDFAV